VSVFKKDNRGERYIEPHIKDFAIERIRKGETPTRIKSNIKRLYDIDVSLTFVWRVRKQYMKITGEYLKNYREIYKENSDKRNK
jgi:predicted small secreted protein